jgi:medium-chain acyl-[acyl-carrier-protein] hydrolase
MGALVAFELARFLRRRGRPAPAHLFVASHPAPQLCGPPVTERPSDDELLAHLRGMQAHDGEAAASDELLTLLLPRLRADYLVCAGYGPRNEAPLGCPITAFGGDRDPYVAPEVLQAWSGQTQRAFALHLMPGGHFFLHREAAAVLTRIAASLSNLTTGK